MNFASLVLQILSMSIMLLIPVLLVRIGARAITRSVRQWLPAPDNADSRPQGTRLLEALLLCCISLPVFALLVFESRDQNYLPAVISSSTPQEVRLAMLAGMTLGVIAIVLSVIQAWRRSTLSAAVMLGVTFAMITLSVNVTRSHQRRTEWQNRNQVKANPLFRFELSKHEGADLFVNGVGIGKSPVTISLHELFEKVPAWTYEDRRAQTDEEPDWRTLRLPGPLPDRWESAHLGLQKQARQKFPMRNVFVAADYAGMKGYTSAAQLDDRDPDLTIVSLHTVFPQWETEIEQLLDHARLNNYAPSPDWYATFTSYDANGWHRLLQLKKAEPEIEKLLDGWSEVTFKLSEVTDSAAAIEKLRQIADSVVKKGGSSYDSRSLHGHAVSQLIPLLNVDDLVRFAWSYDHVSLGGSYGHSTGDAANPHLQLQLYSSEDHTDVLRAMPAVQAVWMIDRRLDAESPDTDHLIEEQFTPELLRNNQTTIARELGGRTYEKYLLRQNWLDPVSDSVSSVSVGDHDNRVNRFFVDLMTLDSPRGRQFRTTHADRILRILSGSIDSVHRHGTSVPRHLNFLFMDPSQPGHPPSLAMRFWPEFRRLIHGEETSLAQQWHYLGLMWPESTPQMFIDAYLEDDIYQPYVSLPEEMPTADRFAVYFQLFEKLNETLQASSEKQPASPRQRNRDTIRRRIEQLAHPAGAAMLISRFEVGKYPDTIETLHRSMAVDTTRHDLIDQLAAHQNPEFRSATLDAIRNHPIPRRVALLDQLTEDSDTDIRTQAQLIRAKLLELKTSTSAARSLKR